MYPLQLVLLQVTGFIVQRICTNSFFLSVPVLFRGTFPSIFVPFRRTFGRLMLFLHQDVRRMSRIAQSRDSMNIQFKQTVHEQGALHRVGGTSGGKVSVSALILVPEHARSLRTPPRSAAHKLEPLHEPRSVRHSTRVRAGYPPAQSDLLAPNHY